MDDAGESTVYIVLRMSIVVMLVEPTKLKMVRDSRNDKFDKT